MNKLIVALDCDTLEKAQQLIDKLSPSVGIFKVGSELFTAAGPKAVEAIKKKGADVFLDLKFHDIPNTVAKAVRAAASLNPLMINIHASGGGEMIKAAVGSIKSLPKDKRPILLAVTVLTSMDKNTLNKLGISRPTIKQVIYLARLAKTSGAAGVVCSQKEIQAVRYACGRNFVSVTPGVRPQGAASFDQKRIATPSWAIGKGADFIVVGRPITKAADPLAAAQEIIKQIM